MSSTSTVHRKISIIENFNQVATILVRATRVRVSLSRKYKHCLPDRSLTSYSILVCRRLSHCVSFNQFCFLQKNLHDEQNDHVYITHQPVTNCRQPGGDSNCNCGWSIEIAQGKFRNRSAPWASYRFDDHHFSATYADFSYFCKLFDDASYYRIGDFFVTKKTKPFFVTISCLRKIFGLTQTVAKSIYLSCYTNLSFVLLTYVYIADFYGQLTYGV